MYVVPSSRTPRKIRRKIECLFTCSVAVESRINIMNYNTLKYTELNF